MSITQIFKGDSSGAVKAVLDLNKAIDQTEKNLNLSTKEAKKLEQQAKRIGEQADPQKRYNREVQNLATLVRQGKVELADAEKVAARYGQRLLSAGRAGAQTFGATAIGNARSFALQFVGLSKALDAVVQGFRDVNAEREKAQQAAIEARGGVGELAQLAATTGDPEAEYQKLLAEARSARSSGAADTQDEAARQLFAYVSAGLDKRDRDFAFELKRTNVLQNTGGAATAFAAITTALGAKEVGSFEDFISKALQASSVAPALANEIPQAAARAAGSARQLGISDEFLYAATAIAAKKQGSAAEGGTQIAAFLKQVEKAIPDNPELQGKANIDLIKFLSALPEEQQGFGGILGDRAEAIAGFRVLRDNVALLGDLTKSIDAADDAGLARRSIALPGSDRQQAAAQARVRSQGGLEVSLGDQAALSNLVAAALSERQKTQSADGFSFGERALNGIIRSQIAIEQFFGNPDYERAALRKFAEEGDIKDPLLLQQIADTLGDQTIVLKQIATQQKKPVAGGRQE